MSVYISLDSGGSKTRALLFDDDMNQLGSAMTGGSNCTQTTYEESSGNIRACAEQLFEKYRPEKVNKVFYTMAGDQNILFSEIKRYTSAEKYISMPEPVTDLYAGALCREGIVALSGTGSDVFSVNDFHGENEFDVVGGFGPILGDQGSGTWMGMRVLREVVKAYEGWGKETVLLDLLWEEWQLKNIWSLVDLIHHQPSPFRKAAAATRILHKAVDMGDETAKEIIREASEKMARQTICLIEKANIRAEKRKVFCAGGAWKVHPMMFESFRSMLRERFNEIEVQMSLFEPVMAGPARILLERNMERDLIKKMLTEKFPQYAIEVK